jgi:hypothetical protein
VLQREVNPTLRQAMHGRSPISGSFKDRSGSGIRFAITYIRRKAFFKETCDGSLKGIVARLKKTVSLEDMNSAIEKMGRMP